MWGALPAHRSERLFISPLCQDTVSALPLQRSQPFFLTLCYWVGKSVEFGELLPSPMGSTANLHHFPCICNKTCTLISAFLTLHPLSVGSELEEETGCSLLSFLAAQQLVVAFFTGRPLFHGWLSCSVSYEAFLIFVYSQKQEFLDSSAGIHSPWAPRPIASERLMLLVCFQATEMSDLYLRAAVPFGLCLVTFVFCYLLLQFNSGVAG